MIASVRGRLERLRRQYAPHEHRPLDGYVVTMGAFGVLAGSLAAAAKLTGRPVPVSALAGRRGADLDRHAQAEPADRQGLDHQPAARALHPLRRAGR